MLAPDTSSENAEHGDDAGFSTLEAIVAIGILAIALIPLYQLQGTISDGVLALERNHETRTQSAIAATYLSGLQPAALAAGEANIGEYRLSWTNQPLTTSRPALASAGLPGRFNVNLSRVEYTIMSPDQPAITGYITRLTWAETSPFFNELANAD